MGTHPVGRFLQSVSLGLDLGTPARFAHFRPTPKSAQVVRAIVSGVPSAATMVVAAYGSGKSLAAGFACLALSGEPSAAPLVDGILDRLREFDPELAAGLRGVRGMSVALEGAQSDLADGILSSASSALGTEIARPGRPGIVAVLDAVVAAARERGLDRVAIVWDEFGRHLEALASEGRAHDLAHLQQAAEWAARQDAPSATLTLLMHQGFFHYTGGLSQAARSAWRKVEGRFGSVRFVDDSREMHRLIASVVEDSRDRPQTQGGEDFHAAAERALAAGLFPAFGEPGSLAEVLAAAWPLDPAALHVLPGLAARVAQHERSVFSFLASADLFRRVTLKDVYDHFAPAMEADVGIGGVHRRWLETESALSKTDTAEETLAVAAAALLGLGASGQRLKVSRDTLLAAAAPHGDTEKAAEAVDALLARKLLLHRHRTDDVSVWHGTDLDLRARLDDERSRLEADFDLVAFLSSRRPAPSARPVRHNLARWVRRSWTGSYVRASDLCSAGRDHPMLGVSPGEDGHVLYVLAAGPQDAERALQAVPSLVPEDGSVVACVSVEPLPLLELAVEVACLERLARDESLLGSDPLAGTEIAHMADAAMEALDRSLDRAVTPGRGRQAWFACRRQIGIIDAASLAEELSVIAEGRFSRTPEIRNELVVRRKLSRPMVNARKRVLLGILERDGQPHLGFEYAGGTPDVAMYRTVLHRTGLYREEGDGWSWAAPFQLPEGGLRRVWMALQEFFEVPGSKSFAELVSSLLGPPFGLRQGLLPILVAAGMKAFGRAVAVRRDGSWVRDILASEVEDMCSRPEAFQVEVFDLGSGLGDYLRGLAEEFGHPAPEEVDLLRHAQDALEAWKAQLPDNALASRHPDPIVRQFQLALTHGQDPVDVLLRRLPQVAKAEAPGAETIDAVSRCRKVIESVVEAFGVGHETNNALDGLLIDGRPADVRDGVFLRDHEHGEELFARSREMYLKGAAALDPCEFAELVCAQRRRLFFTLPDTPESAPLSPWRLTVFHHAGRYIRFCDTLAAGRPDDDNAMRQVVKGLNRTLTGMMADDTEQLWLARSIGKGDGGSGRLATVPPVPRKGMGHFRVKVSLAENTRRPSIRIEPGIGPTDGAPSLDLTPLLFEYLMRVAEGSLPSSFSRQCHQEIRHFAMNAADYVARAYGGGSVSEVGILSVGRDGRISSRQIEVGA